MGHSDVHLVWLLSAGGHVHPRKGGCLLELVSAVPGGRWNAHPDPVDPVLGVLARAVNDRTSSAQRPALAQLIPWLACMPRTGRAEATAAVVTTAAAAAVPIAGPDVARQLSSDAAAACTEVDAVGLRRWLAYRARHRAAARAVRLTVNTLVRSGGDEALRKLLIDAIDQLRLVHALPALPPLTRTAEACRGTVPVQSKLLAPDGGDSIYLHCTALIDLWPAWLQQGSAVATADASMMNNVAGKPVSSLT